MKTESLRQELARLLRGESSSAEGAAELIDIGRIFYRAGRADRPYFQTELPTGFRKEAVEAVERFTLACWRQGRRDALEGRR